MHLLYTRFWTKAMRDLGLVEFDEPMLSLFNQGIILGEDSEKMSKSRGNVVDPDALVAEHGADAVRAYLMFIGPWDQGGLWDPRGIQGPVRFLHDVWELAQSQPGTGAAQFQPGHGAAPSQPGTGAADPQASRMLRRAAHQTLARVTADYEAYAFNTAIAAMMELRNTLKELRGQLADAAVWDEAIDMLLLMLAPVAPHIAEELWARRGNPYSIHLQPWPAYDAAAAAEDHVEIGVQIQGKLRDRVTLPADVGQEQAVAAALASPVVQEALNGAEPRRVIYVPGRLVNIVP
jgi:leucyl-tRNA synthetase